MSGARNVEVLRGVLAEVEPMDDSSWDARERRQVLTAAVSTLEALERQGVIVATGAPEARETPSTETGCLVVTKSAEDSKAARIRELEQALIEARDSLQHIGEGRCGNGVDVDTMGYALNRAAVARRFLHPHKSWCRDTEHEGVCISDPSEETP